MAGIAIVLAGFLLHWIAIILKWERIKPFTKTLGMVLLIAWTLTNLDFQLPGLAALLIAALTFGLAGDILLALADKWFTAGLGAFLLGHVAYLSLITFSLKRADRIGLLSAFSAWMILPFVLTFVAALVAFSRVIVKPLRKKGPDRTFLVALHIYAFCLTGLMVFSGYLTFLFSGSGRRIWAILLGGTFFFISDFILAFDRFVRRVRLGQLWVMITYYLAQFFLAFGFVAVIAILS
ncbi:MAG: lysoplasmalogenase [Chloroflexota bacterium]|nr:lysoplasmalogenase [Chloroflexota bacterium]